MIVFCYRVVLGTEAKEYIYVCVVLVMETKKQGEKHSGTCCRNQSSVIDTKITRSMPVSPLWSVFLHGILKMSSAMSEAYSKNTWKGVSE